MHRPSIAKKILIVDDDVDIAELVAVHLREIGCDVVIVSNGHDGLDQASSCAFDLVVLDVMLPGVDGFQICRSLRAQHRYTPILMLTARSADLDRVLGLELGADDYLTKPFNVQELLARVKGLFRRIDAALASVAQPPAIIHASDLLMDPDGRTVTVRGRAVVLTTKEFDLLAQLARHPGRVYTRSQLLDLVWGYGQQNLAHTVNSHINRLRAKLETDPAQPRYVMTVWGLGYKFQDQESAADR
jgi:DNA-binding response OmpR family regulator